ncbi:MAG TPA: alginate export family protein [Thermodesulfovibrionales bacterium]|nr:alginate export family protein [Thermodesulfovibrionales bacterium]
MKYHLVILLGILLLLGSAESAFAIHAEIPSETQAVIATGGTQITIGGQVRVRAEVQQNTRDFNSNIPDHQAYTDQRVRLSVEAKITPNTIGMIQLESTNENTSSIAPDLNIWGNYGSNPNVSTSYATGLYVAGNAKHSPLSVLQAWIQYSGTGLFGVPAGVKVGHMPLMLGNGIFLDHSKFGDDAILFFMDPVQDFHVIAWTAKFREGNTVQNDDANAYVLVLNYAPKTWSAAFDATFIDDQRSFGTAATVPGAFNAAAPSFPPGPFYTNGPGPNSPTHFWNFGLHLNANIDGFALKGDGELQAGKIDNASPNGKADFTGWAAMLGGSYKLDPVTLSLEWAYGSGPSATTQNVPAFITSLGNDQRFTYVYEYRTVNACGQQSGGICNTQYLKLGGAAELAKDLNSYLSLYWLHANKVSALIFPTGGQSSKDIGWEVDAKLNYKIDRNLNWWVEGGYLFAGNFWETVQAVQKQPLGSSVDNAYAARTGIQLDF